MFPSIEDWEVFKARVAFICELIIAAIKVEQGKHLVSVDEKTGIQVENPARRGSGTKNHQT